MKIHTPIVSIIIPIYNAEEYVTETIESSLNQTYKEFEIIIVDDGSTDKTKEICKILKQKDTRINYYYKNNSGPSATRNFGLIKARGEYIQFIDSDDLIEKDKLKIQVEFLQNNPDIDFVYSDVRYFTDGKPSELRFSRGIENKKWLPEISGNGHDYISFVTEHNFIVTHAPLFRKSVFDKAGLLDERLLAYEDHEFNIRCALHNLKFQYLPAKNTRALVRVHKGSLSHQKIMYDSHPQMYNILLNKILFLDNSFNNLNKRELKKNKELYKKILDAIVLYNLRCNRIIGGFMHLLQGIRFTKFKFYLIQKSCYYIAIRIIGKLKRELNFI